MNRYGRMTGVPGWPRAQGFCFRRTRKAREPGCDASRVRPVPEAFDPDLGLGPALGRALRGQASATGLPALVGSDSGKSEEVDHPEVSGPAVPLRDRRLPPPLGVQVRVAVELEQPDEDLADDAAADRPEVSPPVAQDETLIEDVGPERRGAIEVQSAVGLISYLRQERV